MTTMHFIHQYLKPEIKIIEIGAGTGRYSVKLGQEGYDVTLLLGPMYHLFSEDDQHKALDEAIRVTKTSGVILVAFLSVHAVLYSNFLKGNFEAGIKINLDENYKPTHYDNQVFTALKFLILKIFLKANL